MILIDGKMISQKIKNELKRKMSTLIKKPSLAVIRVGEDEASKIYIDLKRKMCEELGITFTEYHLKDNIQQEDLLGLIHKLNSDDETTAILLQSPIPYHLNILDAFKAISPDKDVDGFNPINVGKLAIGQRSFAPCTPLGIMRLLSEYNINVEGKNCVVVGRSNIVGRPMAQLLLNAHGTVTVCHSKTKDLKKITKEADILVVAIGRPGYITADMVKEGAVVIDVGINRVSYMKKIVGDVDFENVKDKCSYITPVPGGVGPMTIITLMENVIKTAE
ncbi:MAG: bifunctional 5,10-methylenetetrahydrofolate dehydrogenase/5,10-methenyltetrahydrofolate cyclohydrolase [Clostridia bacterium]|nr:bifunctional 5,10-methylenetetrahydrofolate dehydrogenase/5,10-methenyltetrahydrofolate cyclohydrolase [Clostridia bacterium]